MEKLLLTGSRLTLRPVRLSDAPFIQENITQQAISRWIASLPNPYPPNGALQFIRKVTRQRKKGTYYSFAIILDGRPAGIISLHEISTIHKRAEVGYWLAKRFWSRGLMSEALQLLLGFGFRTLGLHRIHATAFAHNAASRRVLEKASFRQEGVRRQQFWDGRWRDIVEYGLLKEEYLDNKNQNQPATKLHL